MRKLRLFLLLLVACMVMGCSIPTKNIVGLQEYKLDPQQIDGTWINSDGALTLKVMEADKGIVRIEIQEESKNPEIYTIKIMKGKSWLYFNLLPDDTRPEIYWGKVKIENNRIFAWHPSDKAFIKAIEEGKIAGTTNPQYITDTAKNIVELSESAESAYFQWEDPMYLMKPAK